MNGFCGADTAQLDAHADTMHGHAETLLEICDGLGPLIMNEQAWIGSDAAEFRDRWQADVSPSVRRACAQIASLGAQAHAHALEQDLASQGDHGSVGDGAAYGRSGDGPPGASAADDAAAHSRASSPSASGGYDYDRYYEFDLGDDGPTYSGEMLWTIALSNFSDVFPIPGMPNNPQVGDQFDLMFNPVEVVEVGPRSLTLESLPGHVEGAGNEITFIISEDGTSLDIEARGPDATWFPNVLPDIFWPRFADNLADLHDVQILAPGPDGLAPEDQGELV